MHHFEKNIVEIKHEYTNFLTNIMAPLIYEGIKNIYDGALKTENKYKEAMAVDPNIQNPGVLKIFQSYLKDVQNLNDHLINSEYERIRNGSKCSDWFDDLVKAVVKSNIILLTFNASGKKCKLVKDKHHENIRIESFIHKSYIECARVFYNYPEIFYHNYSTIDIKRNQREAHSLIKEAIAEAIRKMLPVKLILQEYLKKDYVDDDNKIETDIPSSSYTNMQTLLRKGNLEETYDSDDDKPQHNSKYSNSYHKILEDEDSESDKDFDDEIEDLDKKIDDDNVTENFKELIYGKEETNLTNNTEQLSNVKEDVKENLTKENVVEDTKENIVEDTKENIVKNEIVNNNNTQNQPKEPEKKVDYERAQKLLENFKKPKDPLLEMFNQYKTKLGGNNSVDKTKGEKNIEDKPKAEKSIEDKPKVEKFRDNFDYTEKKTDSINDINIKVNKKVNKANIEDKSLILDTPSASEIKSDVKPENQKEFFDKLLKS
ncbi:hypothetical protein Catovirus_2_274 [Catovirus CTV1]|uniref:Uncharacterized protein n=1 Tax=Catovirus CTV1 TaxID=1977631 RepID=A0A1V0SC92_9VIRU|nr:hypothetical protein Catovirus_2_274 [Catovirus CTV1]